MRKLGIFGGTFDPVHYGHLLIAESALDSVALEQVIWVPTPHPHYRQAARFEHRLAMVQRAIANHPAFTIAPIAANCSATTYAIHTLLELQAVYPNTHWYWILGLDTFQTLPRWYRRQEIATSCDWLVASRLLSSVHKQEQDSANPQQICEQVVQQLASEHISIKWQILQVPLFGISATLVRQYCREHRSIRYLVPESVRIYLSEHHLYSAPCPLPPDSFYRSQ